MGEREQPLSWMFYIGCKAGGQRASVLGWGPPCLLLTDFTPSPVWACLHCWLVFFFFFFRNALMLVNSPIDLIAQNAVLGRDCHCLPSMNVFLFSALRKWGMAPVSSFPSVSREATFHFHFSLLFFFLHQSGNWVSVGDKAGLWVEGPSTCFSLVLTVLASVKRQYSL